MDGSGDIIIGVLAIVVGALFCFRGLPAMRIVIAVWGAFVGFSLGAGAVAAATGQEVLGSAAGWIVAIIVAVVFAALAYLYYAVAVVLALGTAGFLIGAGAMTAAVGWNWAAVTVGVVVAVLAAILAITVNLPAILLMIASILGGAVTVTSGAMVLAGELDTARLDNDSITAGMHGSAWWYALYVVLVVAGAIVQVRAYRPHGALRQRWRRRPAAVE